MHKHVRADSRLSSSTRFLGATALPPSDILTVDKHPPHSFSVPGLDHRHGKQRLGTIGIQSDVGWGHFVPQSDALIRPPVSRSIAFANARPGSAVPVRIWLR